MSRRAALALATALASSIAALPPVAQGADAPPAPLVLKGPDVVDGLRTTDVDSDLVPDLVVSSKREVFVWSGARLASAPTWTFAVPPEVTWVAFGPADGPSVSARPVLLGIAADRLLRIPPSAPPSAVEGAAADVRWTDAGRAMLADFTVRGGVLLPTATGYRWIPDLAGAPRAALDLPAPPTQRVVAPGPFLEDRAAVVTSWPQPWFGLDDRRAVDRVWVASDDALREIRVRDGEVTSRAIRTDFLPREGWHRTVLEDLDRDGTPDLSHEATTNDSGSYAFFRTPPEGEGDDLRPPRATIRLRGFQIPPDYTDVDGDGRPDFVVTTIDIDGSNVIAAVTRGRVVARTRAFLNRSGRSKEWFQSAPDAEVESEIGVRILFTYAGAIDVKRSFTILPTADLDGDGRRDLVIRTGEDRLSVRRGVAEGVWSKEATSIGIPAVGRSPDVEGYAADLTGDRRDDVVLLYRAGPGESDRLVVVAGR